MSNDSGAARDPLARRSPQLIAALLDAINDDPEPIPWTDLVNAFTGGKYAPRTIEATIHDLVAYGAIHRTGTAATRHRPDTRNLRPTPLGHAWWTGTNPPERPKP